MRRIWVVAGISWLAVYTVGALTPVGQFGYLVPKCPSRSFGMCTAGWVARDGGLAGLAMTPHQTMWMVGFGLLFGLGLLLSLRHTRAEPAALAILFACSALFFAAVAGFPGTYNAIEYPNDFTFGLTLLVILQLLTPALVAVLVMVKAVRVIGARHEQTNASAVPSHLAALQGLCFVLGCCTAFLLLVCITLACDGFDAIVYDVSALGAGGALLVSWGFCRNTRHSRKIPA